MNKFVGNNVKPIDIGILPSDSALHSRYKVVGDGSTLFPSPFITEWTVAGDAAARTITLPLVSGYSYNCVVNWGDGTTPSLVTSYNDANRIHTYSSDGTYEVKITGTMEGWSFNNGGDKDKITKIVYWGDTSVFDGFKYLNGGFWGCSNLTTIGTGPIPASGTGILSTGLNKCFNGCAQVTTIPSGLFDKHPLANNFTGLFFDSGITSIPSGLFDKNTAATNMSSMFYNCTSLTSIPSGLFDNNTAVTTFYSVFYNCPSITSIPSGLFDNNTAVTDMGYLFAYTSVTSIPSGLFDNNVLVTSFKNAFQSTDITSIPSGLFDNNTAVTDFSSTFYGCSNLTSIPSGMFDYNTAVTDFTACFRGSGITSVPSGLFDNNTAVTTFANCFRDCVDLETTASELYRLNTACTNFSLCFYNCLKLQQNIDLFYQAGEESTRFLNQSINFTSCFDRSSFTGTQGTAPDLWNCSFGTGTPTTTDCWNGAGNSTTSLTNYASIPTGWK